MALFLLLCTDKPHSRELRAATRPDHLAYLAEHADQVKVGGPWMDEAGVSLGSMLVIEAQDRPAAEAFAAADPYARAGLFAQVSVAPWKLVVGGLG